MGSSYNLYNFTLKLIYVCVLAKNHLLYYKSNVLIICQLFLTYDHEYVLDFGTAYLTVISETDLSWNVEGYFGYSLLISRFSQSILNFQYILKNSWSTSNLWRDQAPPPPSLPLPKVQKDGILISGLKYENESIWRTLWQLLRAVAVKKFCGFILFWNFINL